MLQASGFNPFKEFEVSDQKKMLRLSINLPRPKVRAQLRVIKRIIYHNDRSSRDVVLKEICFICEYNIYEKQNNTKLS